MTNSHDAFPWLPEHIEAMKTLWRRGMSASLIAKELVHERRSPSRSAVIGKLHRLGITADCRDPWQPITREPNGRPPSAPKVKTEPIRIVNARAVAAKARVTKGAKIDRFNARSIPLDHRPDTAPLREVADVTNAKPWIKRGTLECTWPVSGEGADTLSCCSPIERGSWCAAHALIGFNPPKTSAKEFIRGLRRFAA